MSDLKRNGLPLNELNSDRPGGHHFLNQITMSVTPKRNLLTSGEQLIRRRLIDPERATKFWLESGSSVWIIAVLISIALAEIVTAGMGLLLKGEVTYDYLLTGLVSALLVSAVVVAGIMWFQTQMRVLDQHRKEAVATNQELNASRQRYRTLIEVANDAIFVANALTGLLEDCNRQAEVLLGMDRTTSSGSLFSISTKATHPRRKLLSLRARIFSSVIWPTRR